MATMVNTAISTAIDHPDASRSPIPSLANGNVAAPQPRSPRSMPKTKYRHLFATHSQSRQSCLTPGAPQSPSFVGFRNLMILVLVFSNLRLMIENYRKVRGHPTHQCP